VHFKQVGLWWECWWHFDQTLVDIVRALPSPSRTWQPEERTWRINAMYVKRLAREIEQAGYQIDGLPDADSLPNEWEIGPTTNRYWRRDIDG
jgi:hypothetical protein